MLLDWQRLYPTLWQYLATSILNLIALIVVAYLTYKSFTILWLTRRSKSKSTSKITVNKWIKVLTTAYLIFVLIYLLTVFILRVAITLLGARISCFVFICAGIFAMIARILLTLIYLKRLHISFIGSIYAYSNYLLIIIAIIDIVGIFACGIWYLYNVAISAYESLSDTDCVTKFNFAVYSIPGAVFDSVINIVILSMFVQRLFVLVRETNTMQQMDLRFKQDKSISTVSSQSASASPKAIGNDDKATKLIALVTKLTVLLLVSVVTTILLLVSVGPWLAGGSSFIDAYINVTCALYCFKFYQKYYKKYCAMCDGVMFQCCIFCSRQFCDHDSLNGEVELG